MATSSVRTSLPLSWSQIRTMVEAAALPSYDGVRGPTNAQERKVRLFSGDNSDSSAVAAAEPRVVLFRDNHAWCPYCQKIWLWLEEKRVDYRIEKVTMFCYGEKEAWYKKIVPSGMLPAVALDGALVTESDDILLALEGAFGPVGAGGHTMGERPVLQLRRLERALFGAWCDWLCRPARDARDEARKCAYFEQVCEAVEAALAAANPPAAAASGGGDGDDIGGYFLGQFSVVDCVFLPYVERMSASLYYYKGWTLRDPAARPRLCAWFDAMERRPTYRGTQSDAHTHAHDLPPQMGGCFERGGAAQQACRDRVDHGPWDAALPDTGLPEHPTAAVEAVARTLRHKDNLLRANPDVGGSADEALRAALTVLLLDGQQQQQQQEGEGGGGGDAERAVTAQELGAHLKSGADQNLRYIRDRVNVPRDMSLWAARRLRGALEETAKACGDAQGTPIPTRHRRDQDPRAFAHNVT